MNEVVKSLISQIDSLVAENAAITKSGGFFTAKQFDNERKAHKMIMQLRFDYNYIWKFPSKRK